MSRGIIYIPRRFSNESYLTDRYVVVFGDAARKLGWQVCLVDRLDCSGVPQGINTVVLVKMPQGEDPGCVRNIESLPERTRLVTYFADLHEKGDQASKTVYRETMRKLLDRSSLVLAAYREAFLRTYPDMKGKFRWFPHCYAPELRFSAVRARTERSSKLLVTGNTHPSYYPLRDTIVRNIRVCLDVVPHPGYHANIRSETAAGKPFRDRYADILSRYHASLATCSRLGYVVAKYFEIPAAGTLLVANRCRDLDDLGFVSGTHYIEVDGTWYAKTIRDIVAHPDRYGQVRRTGTEFVTDRYSPRAAVERFCSFMGELK